MWSNQGRVAPGLPWFHKTLSTPTSDYIELRLCCDQTTSDEDVPVSLYKIYVKYCTYLAEVHSNVLNSLPLEFILYVVSAAVVLC